jgi:hypothetical protein
MTEQSDLQVFISYTKADQARVIPIYEFLICNGYPNTWIDCKKLLPGQPWDFEIKRNLKKSEIVIIFISNNTITKRGYVQRELKIAMSYIEEKLQDDIYIIPIMLDDDAKIPDSLTEIQYLNISSNDSLHLLKQALDTQRDKLGFEQVNVTQKIEDIYSVKKVTKEKWEGLPGYEVAYSWPSFYSTKYPNISEISKIIEVSLLKRLHSYRANKFEQEPQYFSWSQEEFLRTNTFDAHCENTYHVNNFISITYTISWYGAGAAHPNYHFETYNFFLNPLIRIDSIESCFSNPESVFSEIIAFVRDSLKKENHCETDADENLVGDPIPTLTEQWIIDGTGSWASLNAFGFSEKGLVINFAPYQVGPYAAGAFVVEIPYSFIAKHLKQELQHALYATHYSYN